MTIYLYEKQHEITGLKYFGKTIRNPYQYIGSGSYWMSHINKHGKEHIITLSVWSFEDQEECTAFALKFSRDNDIIKSKEWANLTEENGVGGGGGIPSLETRHKLSEARKGKTHSEEIRLKISEANKGNTHSEETRRKMSEAQKRENNAFFGKTHSEETRRKISEAQKGKTLSEEHKRNISEANKGRLSPNKGKSLKKTKGRPWSDHARAIHMQERAKRKQT